VDAPSARLVAVCDLVADRAARAAKQFGAERWYTDAAEMLDQEQLDGVCVCGEPRLHVEVGLQVAGRGLPVFVEKPSAMDSAEARRLAQAAADAGTWGMVAFMKRHAPAYVLARQLVEATEFGGVQQIHLHFTQGEYPDIWGLEAPRAFLVGQVVHIFDLARFLAGDVAEVAARRRTVAPTQFAYAVSIQFASGAVGTMTMNSLDRAVPWRDISERVDLTGVGESITVQDMLAVEHFAARDWRPAGNPFEALGVARHTWSPNWLGAIHGHRLCGYVGEIEHFARCLLSRQPASASLWDGVAALRFGEAVWESAETGRAVQL
jgi:predicted dehydrogenase